MEGQFLWQDCAGICWRLTLQKGGRSDAGVCLSSAKSPRFTILSVRGGSFWTVRDGLCRPVWAAIWILQNICKTGHLSVSGLRLGEPTPRRDCGILKNGFARVRCEHCGHEYLLAHSCKRRHFCPSCHPPALPDFELNWTWSSGTSTEGKCATDWGRHWRAGQKRVVEFGEWLCQEVVKAVFSLRPQHAFRSQSRLIRNGRLWKPFTQMENLARYIIRASFSRERNCRWVSVHTTYWDSTGCKTQPKIWPYFDLKNGILINFTIRNPFSAKFVGCENNWL